MQPHAELPRPSEQELSKLSQFVIDLQESPESIEEYDAEKLDGTLRAIAAHADVQQQYAPLLKELRNAVSAGISQFQRSKHTAEEKGETERMRLKLERISLSLPQPSVLELAQENVRQTVETSRAFATGTPEQRREILSNATESVKERAVSVVAWGKEQVRNAPQELQDFAMDLRADELQQAVTKHLIKSALIGGAILFGGWRIARWILNRPKDGWFAKFLTLIGAVGVARGLVKAAEEQQKAEAAREARPAATPHKGLGSPALPNVTPPPTNTPAPAPKQTVDILSDTSGQNLLDFKALQEGKAHPEYSIEGNTLGLTVKSGELLLTVNNIPCRVKATIDKPSGFAWSLIGGYLTLRDAIAKQQAAQGPAKVDILPGKLLSEAAAINPTARMENGSLVLEGKVAMYSGKATVSPDELKRVVHIAAEALKSHSKAPVTVSDIAFEFATGNEPVKQRKGALTFLPSPRSTGLPVVSEVEP